MRIRRHQDVDDLSVVARLAEAGTVTARARVRLRGGAARLIVSRPARAPVEANRAYRLRLRFRQAACGGSSARCVAACAYVRG